jgi:hypothetical protein
LAAYFTADALVRILAVIPCRSVVGEHNMDSDNRDGGRSDVSAYLHRSRGEGYMSSHDTSDADHLKVLEKVTTAAGAKTALSLPEMHRPFLAVSPGESKQ